MRTFWPVRGILSEMESRSIDVDSSEARLIERARNGDHAAFDALVEAHLRRVWNVVWRILRHREDTEDVVQEVFLTAYRALPDFRGEAKLSSWLQRIAVTRALNHIDRSAEKVRRASRSFDEPPEGSDSENGGVGPAPVPESNAPSPLQALEASELRRRLADCLGRLPAVWRAILTLRDSDEHSYEQIAAMLRIALGTVRSRLARARLALRRCVEGEA